MAVGAYIASFAYYNFRKKNDADWKKLTRFEKVLGFIAREGPMLVRICNFFVFFFICIGVIMVAYGVCRYSVDQYGQETYYPKVRRFLIGCSAV